MELNQEFHFYMVKFEDNTTVAPVEETTTEGTQVEVSVGELHSDVAPEAILEEEAETILKNALFRTSKKSKRKGKAKVPPPTQVLKDSI
uniref:Uncharacterized protein n=1 Tax=Cannabis sativa TaxID=3483 RepID=A0A803PTH6_CANSA